MTKITDWPKHRAEKIAEWLHDLARLDSLIAAMPECGERRNMEALREGLIMDIENYESQQYAEGN